MSSTRPSELPVPTCWRNITREEFRGLDSESYTAQRLQNSSAEHVHITSRRLFVGPLPKGWLSSHRKSWYKSWLGLKDYSSRAATFSADINTAHQRQLTGLLGPSTAAMYRQSFPQPTDLDEDAVDDESVSDEISPEPTAITPIDTAHEAPPQEQEDETSDRTSEPTPERPSLATITDSRTRTQRGSDPTLRPSSSSQVPETFYTAPESPRDATKLTRPRTSPIREESPETGDTSGRENLETPRNMSRSTADDLAPLSSATSPSAEAQSGVDFASETLLLPQGKLSGGTAPVRSSRRLQHEEPSRIEHEEQEGGHRGRRIISRATSGLVRFNLGDNLGDRQRRLQNKLSRTATDDETTVRRQRRASRCGEIVRAERMLVRIETTRQSLPDDFNENDSIKIDTKVMSKWREFLVVCRRGCEDNTPFVLQFYKTRVIPQIQTSDMKKNSSFEIRVLRNHTHVNLFSTLDKTLTLWHPYKLGTRIFVMRPRSSAHAVEWFTFLRGALGWKQPSTLFVHVPDLDISLRLQNPFAHLGETRNENDDVCTAVLRTMKEEQAIAAGIIKTCLTTLSECTEWNKIVAMWGKTTAVGLAWRRYDRLEWVQGPNEQRMYGTIAMRTTHELELRPKQHYPTVAKVESRGCKEEEPLPAEGFLILLTSQRGRQRRFGKNFFRRLYVYTQDQYLCFCRPAKAIPPAPPKIATISGRCVPSSSEIQRDTPIIYEVNPFPVKDGEITWLSVGRKEYAKSRDAEAFAENRRVTANAANSEGYINLCRVSEVRAVTSRDTLPEQNANMGDVEYHGERAQPANGAKPESKDDRSFEIVLDSGLVVRFRAYNVLTRQEWVGRLTKLSEYWKARTKEDMATLKYIRRRNLKRLEINEEQESMLGQFAEKWEVSRAEASPELFHACGMSGCRAIKMSGNLYRKPRRRGAFTHCNVLLIEGQMLVFQGSVRKWTGEPVPHTHHTRQSVIDLRDCYIYSGIITSSDLLYQNQTFDSNLPNQHARPRMYTKDGWTSSDEDTATCFVIWHASRKALFRGETSTASTKDAGKGKKRRWRQVPALGVPGRSIVFKARSRTERDMWVLAIATEIDRLQQQEDLRIVEP